MSKIYRVYVKKREEYAVEAQELFNNIKNQLKIKGLTGVRVINRYDVGNISYDVLNQGINTILSEPMVDDVYLEEYDACGNRVFGIEYLEGQYDQRADATEQCFAILTSNRDVKVKCARLIELMGDISENDALNDL